MATFYMNGSMVPETPLASYINVGAVPDPNHGDQ